MSNCVQFISLQYTNTHTHNSEIHVIKNRTFLRMNERVESGQEYTSLKPSVSGMLCFLVSQQSSLYLFGLREVIFFVVHWSLLRQG